MSLFFSHPLCDPIYLRWLIFCCPSLPPVFLVEPYSLLQHYTTSRMPLGPWKHRNTNICLPVSGWKRWNPRYYDLIPFHTPLLSSQSPSPSMNMVCLVVGWWSSKKASTNAVTVFSPVCRASLSLSSRHIASNRRDVSCSRITNLAFLSPRVIVKGCLSYNFHSRARPSYVGWGVSDIEAEDRILDPRHPQRVYNGKAHTL